MIFFYTFFIFIIHETRESIMQYLTNVLNLTREKHNLLKCHEIKAISQFYKHLWIFVCLLHAMSCCFCVCFLKATAHNTCPLNHQIWFAANFLLDSQFLRLHQMSISITFNTIHSCQLTHTHTWSLSFRKKTTIQPQWASSQLKALTSKWIYRITISTTTSHLSNWSIYLFVEK